MNKTFRRILVGGLALCLSLGMGLSASCKEKNDSKKEDNKNVLEQSLPYAGVTLHFPKKFKDALTSGKVTFDEGELTDGIHYLYVRYVDGGTRYLANLYAVDDGLIPFDVVEVMSDYVDNDDSLTEDMFTEIGRYEDTVFYSVGKIESENSEGSLSKASKKEYKALLPLMEEVLAGATFMEPKDLFEGLVGSKLEFETTDLDGVPVNSKDLFSQHAYTMINVWALSATSSLGEIPSLAIMNDALAEKDAAIVGLLANTDENLEEIKSILSACKVSYVNLLPWEGAFDVLDLHGGLPTSFFVDRDGVVVADPVTGANLDEFEETFDMLLAQ